MTNYSLSLGPCRGNNAYDEINLSEGETQKVVTPLEEATKRCYQSVVNQMQTLQITDNSQRKLPSGRFYGLLSQEPALNELDPTFKEILQNRLRVLFNGEIEYLKLAFDSSKKPSCCIYFNPDEEDVTQWLNEYLIPDLTRLGIRPIVFKELEGQEDFAIVICTPRLMSSSVSDAINQLQLCFEQKKGTIIPVLVKWDDDSNVNAVNPFKECSEDIFAVRAPLDNYAAILQLFVVLLNSEGRQQCRRIASDAIGRIKESAKHLLEHYLQWQYEVFNEITDLDFRTKSLRHVSELLLLENETSCMWKSKRSIFMQIPTRWSNELKQGKLPTDEMASSAKILGDMAFKERDMSAAKIFFESGVSISCFINGPAHAKTLDFQLLVARCCYDLDQIDEAIEACNKVIRAGASDEHCFRAYHNLGNLYGILEQFELAEKMFLLALNLPQANAAIRVDYAHLLMNFGRDEDAVKYLEDVILSSDESRLSYGGIDIPCFPAWQEKAFVDYLGPITTSPQKFASFLLQHHSLREEQNTTPTVSQISSYLVEPTSLADLDLKVKKVHGGNFWGLVPDEGVVQKLSHEVVNCELRKIFEGVMVALKKMFTENSSNPTCFICFNTDEKDVTDWLTNTLIPDLEVMGVRPVCSLTCLDAGKSLEAFEARAGTEDFAIVICTPALKKKLSNPKSGVSIEISHMQQRKKGTTIPVLLKWDYHNSANDVNPFKDHQDVHAVKAPLDNYTTILQLFALLIDPSRSLEAALFIANEAIKVVTTEGIVALKQLHSALEKIDDEQLRKETVHKVTSALNKKRIDNQIHIHCIQRQKEAVRKWVIELSEKPTLQVTGVMLGAIHDLVLHEAKQGNAESARTYLFHYCTFCQAKYGPHHDYTISYQLIYAKTCYDQKKIGDAVDMYNHVIGNVKSDAYKYRALFNLGRLYLLESELDLAEECFLTALNLPQASTIARIDYACVLMHQNRYNEAISILTEIIYNLDDKSKFAFGEREIPNPTEEYWHLTTQKVTLRHFAFWLILPAYRLNGQNERADKLAKEFAEI